MRGHEGGLTVLVPAVDHDRSVVNLSDNRDNDTNNTPTVLNKWNK